MKGLNRENLGLYVLFSTLDLRHFGRESDSYSETNWQGSFDFIRTRLMGLVKITQSAAYVSCELSHLYGHNLSKELVRGLRKPRTSFSCRLYEQFAAYISRGLCNPRLIFPRINRPIVIIIYGRDDLHHK